jgi:hypothetical protein
MKKIFYEGNQIHNFMSSSGSGTVINYGSGYGSDFFPSYGSGYGSGSTSQKVTVPTVPVPVPQHCKRPWYRTAKMNLVLSTSLSTNLYFTITGRCCEMDPIICEFFIFLFIKYR